MRQLSEREQALLRALYHRQAKGRGHPLPEELEARERALAELTETANVAVAAYVSTFILLPSTRRAAVTCIAALLERATTRELLELDDMRGAANTLYGGLDTGDVSWWRAAPEDVNAVSDVWSLGLLSFHHSGYVREAAAVRLAKLDHPASVAFLLIRANDWVLPVREGAKAGLAKWTAPDRVRAFATYLPLLQRLRHCGRADHVPMVEELEGLLGESPANLEPGLASEDRHLRRACFKLGLRATPSVSIIQRALDDGDTIVRRSAARIALSTSASKAQYLEQLANDRAPMIRALVVDACADQDTHDAKQMLRRLAIDSSARVRQAAQYWLQTNWKEPLADFYREELKQTALPSPGMLLGLAETGTNSDAATMIALIGSERTSMRRTAIRGLAMLDSIRHLDLFYAAMRDPRASVSHAGRDALTKAPAALEIDRLAHLLVQSPPHGSRDAARLLAASPGWDGVVALVRALGHVDGPAKKNIIDMLTDWRAPSFIAPSAAQRDALLEALDANRNEPAQPVRARLRAEATRWS